MFPYLANEKQVNESILSEEDRMVIILFGENDDPEYMALNAIFENIYEKVKTCAVFHLVDSAVVSDCTMKYEFLEQNTLLFFYHDKRIVINEVFTNDNNIKWPIVYDEEMIDLIEKIYNGALEGRGLDVRHTYDSRYRY